MGRLLTRTKLVRTDVKFTKQLIQFIILSIGLIFVVFSLPIADQYKESILQLLGIITGAAIALSSTTFIANAMSGIMLRIIKPFRVGDYIESEDIFGRVTDIHILHTEVQSIDRDLVTFPNLKLVSNPLKTIRTSGTIICTCVSLGYDVPRQRIEKNLLLAAEKTGLENPFVHVLELGDFSVTYKVGGLLKNIESLITARSDFKKAVLDALHEADVEIVSPNFMNQRILKEGTVFIPPKELLKAEVPEKPPKKKPEEIIFDKAIEAEILGRIEIVFSTLEEKEKELGQQVSGVPEQNRKAELSEKLEFLKTRKEEVKTEFEAMKKQMEESEEIIEPEMRSRQLQSLNLKADHLDIRRKKLEKELKEVLEKEEAEKSENRENLKRSQKN
ncbi:mechanosensitive ion channel domain-containing protein [Methanosarcina sp. KYL-1]|uniref:mechanosensitive ion channel family protein n=1 Tax=Methanosarcina sp. KYL-1 TaxID=2602068 RepID=UPI002100F2D6